MSKCIVAYHKIDFYIPNQLFISVLLRLDGYNSHLGFFLQKNTKRAKKRPSSFLKKRCASLNAPSVRSEKH